MEQKTLTIKNSDFFSLFNIMKGIRIFFQQKTPIGDIYRIEDTVNNVNIACMISNNNGVVLSDDGKIFKEATPTTLGVLKEFATDKHNSEPHDLYKMMIFQLLSGFKINNMGCIIIKAEKNAGDIISKYFEIIKLFEDLKKIEAI